jgi:hypothetical protein
MSQNTEMGCRAFQTDMPPNARAEIKKACSEIRIEHEEIISIKRQFDRP